MLTKTEDNTQKTTKQMMHVDGRDNGTDMRSNSSTEDANKAMRQCVHQRIHACLFFVAIQNSGFTTMVPFTVNSFSFMSKILQLSFLA